MVRVLSTKERLLEVATIEFASKGARAVGVEQLCNLAEINKGSFYHYFPSKQALILGCLDAEWDHLRENLLGPAFSQQNDPLGCIDTYFRLARGRQQAFYDQHGLYPGCLMCNLGNELGLEDPDVHRRVQEYHKRNSAYLHSAFSHAFHDRSVKKEPSEIVDEISFILPAAFFQVRALQDLGPLLLANGLIMRIVSQEINIKKS